MKKRLYASLNTNALLFSAFFIFVTLLPSCGEKINSEEVLIYLVRHAEKDLSDPANPDPLLTDIGVERAQTLKTKLKDVEFDAIYSTDYQRTINTVKPICEERGLEMASYASHNWQQMIDEMVVKKGRNFLICGHSDNLLPMIDYLGLPRPIPEIGHDEYDKLFKIRLSNDSSGIEMLTY